MAAKKLVAQGWMDSLRETHPGEVIYTYWDYFRNAFGRNAGLRMDHLLLSPVLKPRVESAGVDPGLGEDQRSRSDLDQGGR
jgi:exodeoxyribonuclease-3